MKDIYWGESQCIGSWLHRYQTLGMWENGISEICSICKNKIFFPVKDGRIDNMEYIDHHKREVLPEWHPYFKHEYAK